MDEGDSGPGSSIEKRVSEAERAKSGDSPYRCAECEEIVASPDDEIAVEGGFRHTFPNPSGIVFTIGCFEAVRNTLSRGRRHEEFSWFPGYTWQVLVCGGCGSHLGWEFRSGDRVFWGLILDRIEQ